MGTRIAFVGSGGMASAHLKAIGPIPDAEIVALCDIDRSRSDLRAAEIKGIQPSASPAIFTDVAAMLDSADPDAVYILLPPFAHGAAERACLERRKPFFVEKPISNDLGLSIEIAQEVERAGVLTGAGYMNRYRTGVQRARELLRDDPAVLVYGGWIGGAPNPQPDTRGIGSWWVQQDKSGGQIVEQCTHTFDVLRYICGEATEVFAHAARGFNEGIYGYTIDDASAVNIQLASGAVANLMSCCAADGGGGGVSLNLFAKGVTLQFTGWDHSLKIVRKGQEPEEIKGEPDIFAVEDRAFLAAVQSGDGGGIRSTYPDAVKTLELTLAANESIATGRPVPIRAGA